MTLACIAGLFATVFLADPSSLAAAPTLPAQSSSQTSQGFSQTRVDEEDLAGRVRARLFEDRHHLSRGVLASVHIEARGGFVLLQGSVPTPLDRQLIDTLTRSVDGVRAVDNQLLVPGEEPPYHADGPP